MRFVGSSSNTCLLFAILTAVFLAGCGGKDGNKEVPKPAPVDIIPGGERIKIDDSAIKETDAEVFAMIDKGLKEGWLRSTPDGKWEIKVTVEERDTPGGPVVRRTERWDPVDPFTKWKR